MHLLKIEIEEFGKLSGCSFALGEGLNLFEGANESGKSTLLAFIRFVLYGFPRKVGLEGEEREKRLSWRTQRAAGRLVLRTATGDFSVFRSVTRQGSATRESFSETLLVSALASGDEISLDGKSPGEYFLGLPATLYDSTLCLKQSDAARVSEPGVGEAVSELFFSGSAGVGADTALEKMRLARRELQHQKGRGGRIADLVDSIAQTQDALLRAREDDGVLSTLRADVARYRKQIYDRRSELEQITGQLESVAAKETLALFDRSHAAQSVCEQKRLNYEAVCAQNAAFANLPATISGVQEALRERQIAERECLQALPELERMRATHHDENKLAAQAILQEKGGAQNVLADFRMAQKKKKRAGKVGIVFLIVALVIFGVTCLIASGLIVPLLLLFLPVGTYLPDICLIGLGASVLLFLIAGGFFLRAARFGGRARAWTTRLGVREPKMFRTYLEQCATEAQSAEAHRTLLIELESVYTEKLGRVSRAEERVRACLVEGGLNVPEDLNTVPELLSECEERYRAVQEALLAARGEWERASAAWESLRASLEGKNEAELRARYTDTGTWNVDELRRKQAFLREALSGLEKKCADTERREIALSATAKDTATKECELAALRAEHKSATRRLAALEMALGAMEEATRNLREGLIPRLCERASVHLAALTAGKYQKLYTGADMKISLDSDKGPLPLSHFSAGSRDAAHLALRLGLLDTLSEERLPLLLDEAFSRFDDDRAYALLQLLLEYCHMGGQCLLFTCHSRESRFLADKEYIRFEL